MEPGDRIVRRGAYQTRQSACEVLTVMRVTAGGSLRLTSGKLERAEYCWRLASPVEVAAWDAAVAAQAAANMVAGHMSRCPRTATGWGGQRVAAEVGRQAAAVLAWAAPLAELQAQLEAAMGAAAVALEACQPTKGA
jgi:hypothetical protein